MVKRQPFSSSIQQSFVNICGNSLSGGPKLFKAELRCSSVSVRISTGLGLGSVGHRVSVKVSEGLGLELGS